MTSYNHWPAKGTSKYNKLLHKISRIAKHKWSSQAYRVKQAKAIPKKVAKLSKAANKHWQCAEYRNRVSTSVKSTFSSAKWRKRKSLEGKKRWQNQEYAAKVRFGIREAMRTSQGRAKHSAAAKKNWTSLEYRTKMATTKKRNGTVKQSKWARAVLDLLHIPQKRREFICCGKLWDAVIPRAKVLIECHGCLYHECTKCGHEGAFGGRKRKQDATLARLIRKHGWRVMYIWEHEKHVIASNPKHPLRKLCGV